MPNVDMKFDIPDARIALVEDDHYLRCDLSSYLRVRGLTVVEAECGQALLDRLADGQFDVVILDTSLPDMCGYKLAGAVHAIPRTGLVMMACSSSPEDRVHGYSSGADVYLIKPVGGRELLSVIRNLLRRIRHNGNNWLAVEALVAVEPAWILKADLQCLVTPKGNFIRLSGREYLLLECLASRERAFVTRAELSSLLGYDKFGPMSRSLDSLLHRLRQKVDAVDEVLPINLIHAVGMRFSVPLRMR